MSENKEIIDNKIIDSREASGNNIPTEPVIPIQIEGTNNDDSSDEDGGKTFYDLIYFLLTSWKGFPRMLAILISIGLVIFFVLWASLYMVKSNRLEITQTQGGGIIYRVGKEETLTFLLSASAPWDSPKEFRVNKGDWLTIRASGKVNLAIHHLVDASKNDTRPQLFWNGPEGVSKDNMKLMQVQDKYRGSFVLEPRCPYGALIAGISKSKDDPPSSKDAIWCVGSYSSEPAPTDGVLWFAVNDVLLKSDDSPNKEIYEVPLDKRSENYIPPRKWDDIKKDEYWNVWFDDNIGEFMVIVQKDN